MCVQTEFKKCLSCEIMTIVDFRSANTPSNHRIALMSKLLVGSSSNRISGSENNACANRTRSFHPGAIALI